MSVHFRFVAAGGLKVAAVTGHERQPCGVSVVSLVLWRPGGVPVVPSCPGGFVVWYPVVFLMFQCPRIEPTRSLEV